MPIPRAQLDKREQIKESVSNWYKHGNYIRVSTRCIADVFGIKMGTAYTIGKELKIEMSADIADARDAIIVGTVQQNERPEVSPNTLPQTKTILEVRQASYHDNI